MKKLLNFKMLTLLLNLCILNAFADESTKDLVLVSPQVYSSDSSGQYLAINFKNKSHWHTYWDHPGDAGTPFSFTFEVSGKQINITKLPSPSPKKYIEQGDLITFGHEGEYTYFFKLDKAVLRSIEGKNIIIKSNWLVCKNICIPGGIEIKGEFSNGDLDLFKAPPFKLNSSILKSRFNDLPRITTPPKTFDFDLYLNEKKNGLILFSKFDNVTSTKFLTDKNLLTPFGNDLLDFRHEKITLKDNTMYSITPIDWDGEYNEPPVELPKNGKFKKALKLKFLLSNPLTQRVELIEKTFNGFKLSGSKALSAIMGSTEQQNLDGKNSSGSSPISPLMIILFAFIGGLILNIMPCVLPVISLKLFSLIKYRNASRKEILLHNLSYSMGVIFSFLLLAAIILILKSLGSFVGWGFQLQSPIFVSLMIIFLFIFTLNLFGLFEFSTPGGKNLGSVQTNDGFGGDFLSGIIATILSTPCSAPFLGSALTVAFSSSPLVTLGIFLVMALGLSSPFILIGLFPSMIKFLPKPGEWMIKFKYFLGLSMLLTAIWLFDVLTGLVNDLTFINVLNLSLALIFFSIFFRKKISQNLLLNAITVCIPIIILITSFNQLSNEEFSDEKVSNSLIQKGWSKWTPELMEDLKNNKTVSFIDFTAKWCLTCKVNKKLVIDTDEFQDLVKENNINLVMGDWTKRDDVIGNFLKENGLVGVPAYFLINQDGELINFGETISIGKLKKHL